VYNEALYRRHDARRPQRSFARWNQWLRHSPTPTGFAKIVGDYFPVTHAMDCASFFARQTAAKRRRKSEFPFRDDASDFSSPTRIRIKRLSFEQETKKELYENEQQMEMASSPSSRNGRSRMH